MQKIYGIKLINIRKIKPLTVPNPAFKTNEKFKAHHKYSF